MISVIIPLMPIEPYRTQIDACKDSIQAQNTDAEIVVMIQKESRYISKNILLNDGISQSTGRHLFFCDADFILDDKSILRRMRQRLDWQELDVIFPMFMSTVSGSFKLADGAVFTTRKLMKRFGRLDESLEGISWVTFPFLKWCLDNAKWHCSNEFTITVDQSHKSRKKRHGATSSKMRPIYKKVVSQLQQEGVWP